MSENPNQRAIDIINEEMNNIGNPNAKPEPKEEVSLDPSIRRNRIREAYEDEAIRKANARTRVAVRQAKREREEQLENAARKTKEVQNKTGYTINVNELNRRVRNNQTIQKQTIGMTICNGFIKVAEAAKKAVNTITGKAVGVFLTIGIVSGTMYGITGCHLDDAKALENDLPANDPMEQEADSITAQDLAKASELAEKGQLTEEETAILKQANVGNNPTVGHFDDATPLSEDPNYTEPNLDELREAVVYEEAMKKDQNDEALTKEEVAAIQNHNTTGNTLEPDWFSTEKTGTSSISSEGMSR